MNVSEGWEFCSDGFVTNVVYHPTTRICICTRGFGSLIFCIYWMQLPPQHGKIIRNLIKKNHAGRCWSYLYALKDEIGY